MTELMTRAEVEAYAETTAQQLLGVDWATALAMLRAGELGHTVAQAEVTMCAMLLGIATCCHCGGQVQSVCPYWRGEGRVICCEPEPD